MIKFYPDTVEPSDEERVRNMRAEWLKLAGKRSAVRGYWAYGTGGRARDHIPEMSTESAAAAPPISTLLSLDADTPVVSTMGVAHDAFMDLVPTLLRRLALSEDAESSSTKKVVVRGALFDATHIGVKFSAEFKDGKLQRVRIMTARGDEDLTKVPAEYGGTGLMAAGGSGVLEADDTRAAPVKRKRAKVEDPASIEEALARACELARLHNRADLVPQIDALLKAC
jgi:hypothetical protein